MQRRLVVLVDVTLDEVGDAFAEALDTGFGGSTVPEILDEMKKFRDEVMAKA